MKRLFRILRAILLTVAALAVFVPAAVYIVLSTDWAMEKLRVLGEEELSRIMGTDVNIGQVSVQPFNRVALKNVKIADDYGVTALDAAEAETRFEFWNFITTGRLAFDYVVLDDVDVRLYKETPESPLNIAGIIENLKSKEEKKEPTRFDLSLYTVKLQNARFSFDILDAPKKEGVFDASHIRLYGMNLIATAPKLSDSEISGRIRRLSFTDSSGFSVENFTAEVMYTPTSLKISDLVIDLPESHFDLGTYEFEYDKIEELKNLFKVQPLKINIFEGSYVTLSDFGSFVPNLSKIDNTFDINADINASENRIAVNVLEIKEASGDFLNLNLSGEVFNPLNADSLEIKALQLFAEADAPAVADLLGQFGKPLAENITAVIERLGDVRVNADVSGKIAEMQGNVNIATALGSAAVKGTVITPDRFKSNIDITGNIETRNFEAGRLLNRPEIGAVTLIADGQVVLKDGRINLCDVEIEDVSAVYQGHSYRGTDSYFQLTADGAFSGRAEANVDRAEMLAAFSGSISHANPSVQGKVTLSHFSPNELGLTDKYAGYDMDVDLDFDLAGDVKKWVDGYVEVSNFSFRSGDTDKPRLELESLRIEADKTMRPNTVTLTSDIINGTVEGNICPATIIPQVRNILASVMPSIGKVKTGAKQNEQQDNHFKFNFVVDETDRLVDFFHLPVNTIYPITLNGQIDAHSEKITIDLDAPYLVKGDMIIEQTSLQTVINGETGNGYTFVTTRFPTKKGTMSVGGGIHAKDDKLSTAIDWEIEREKPINGTLTFDTEFFRDEETNKLGLIVNFIPCELRFGNDTWKFAPSVITYIPGKLDIKNFGMATDTQSIRINGMCSADDATSEITVDLENVVLNTIFETLDINKALIGGKATGSLHAGGIFNQQPFVTCDNLHVENISYNYCVLGDGDVVARWDNEKGSFYLDAVVSQEDGRKSYIRGDIFPSSESLDITFDADRIKVGFMKPFMEAFAGDITGYASGHARLFGTFKYIDMEGDIFAQDLGLKIDFTNTWYYATDSIHITPGLIDLKNITVRDVENHTALLNGFVKHNFFKDPVFNFRVTEATDFLSYDVTPALSPDWYGRIYGNGSAFIHGVPGEVNIDVNMTTADNSKFTFVLSDFEEAEQYNFITFRDKNRGEITDSIIQTDILPERVRAYKERVQKKVMAQNPPTAYKMDIQMDITPAANVIIVMDPVGGDEIRSWGKGNMRMTYNSIGNELRMYGTYAIDHGSYNFTLQDIIVKDFIIREGSSITFTGDPYNATLDITAAYHVNANLSDLDESFINDPELNRTNVPVNALLVVRGDMRQPDIDFDLEFPTLTSDIYRKVRSIISTDEMMSQQMIYLLALNRFYTPEYMTATRGSEVFSVASSTISSRLSSMLGKLSNNWTISPNLRSDRGDFSDVQFDVALSSNLLNNRLRMNGNFGYRDKSLNTTQFIGDFDLEYLINRTGTWRLKAYNRFNDQTYFLRTAKTTQGVGIKFQREFDDLSGIFRTRKKTEEDDNSESEDKSENEKKDEEEQNPEKVETNHE